MLYYALVSPLFSNSAHLQIGAEFKQYSQLREYSCKKISLLYIKLLFCKLWGIYFLLYSLGSQWINTENVSLSHC